MAPLSRGFQSARTDTAITGFSLRATACAVSLHRLRPPAGVTFPSMRRLRHGRKTLVAVTDRHRPAGDLPAVLAVDDDVGRIDLCELAAQHILADADDDEGLALELVLLINRIGMPQVVLAVPIAQRQAHRVGSRVAGAVKAELARVDPPSGGQHRLMARPLSH